MLVLAAGGIGLLITVLSFNSPPVFGLIFLGLLTGFFLLLGSFLICVYLMSYYRETGAGIEFRPFPV